MKCHYCDHEFNIYKFAYKQLQECPECHTKYEMIFPSGIWMISLFIDIAFSGLFVASDKYNTITQISFLLVVYFVVDTFIKFILIYLEKYTIEEKN